MRIKKLAGTRCYLSPFAPEDAAPCAAWLNDLAVTRFLTLPGANITFESEQQWIAQSAGKHDYAIVENGTDRLLGGCGLMDLDQANGTATLGVFIGDAADRGKGFGSEAIRLLLAYGFDYLNLANVWLKVYAFNEAGIACYRKLGFREIGRRRGALLRERRRHDEVFMDITPEDFRHG